VTSISNINTRLAGVPNIYLDVLSNTSCKDIIKLLPEFDINALTTPTKINLSDSIPPVTIVFSNIEFADYDNKGKYIMISANVSFQK
jgi:hypothetical protein